MRILIGIGNQGEEYVETRHNVGFWLIDLIAKKNDITLKDEKKLFAQVGKGRLEGKPVILAKPTTFVNKSGDAAKKLKLFYKAKLDQIIVIQDDLDIPFGSFKLSFEKDSGGHRGIQSIIDAFKSKKFWRLRIGTANRKLTSARDQTTLKAKKEAVGDFVLSKFTPKEKDELKKLTKQALERLQTLF